VINPDISDTDQQRGEPDVTVNGKKLRMAQATDGNWYGYFADKVMAVSADATTNSTSYTTQGAGRGLDFGQFCSSASTALSSDSTALFTDTVGVAVPLRSAASSNFGINGTAINAGTSIPNCNTAFAGAATSGTVLKANATHTGTTVASGVEGRVSNVVREAKAINTNSAANGVGQIKLVDDGLWPFVQLYTFSQGGNVVVQYNKGGGVQTTTLTFDTVEQFSGISLDRTKYPQAAQVHATITDLWLNIDCCKVKTCKNCCWFVLDICNCS